jgi:hypothetical protein
MIGLKLQAAVTAVPEPRFVAFRHHANAAPKHVNRAR